jgi:hypothetical protein
MFRFRLQAPPVLAAAAGQVRTLYGGLKPKKKNKVGAKFVTDSQTWRDKWRGKREVQFAEGLRGYVNFSTTARQVPYDARFAPFDREERDGVHLVMKHLMADKLALTYNHANPVKRLLCNVGLLGPQISTVARWKPRDAARISAKVPTNEERRRQYGQRRFKGNRYFRD